MLCELHQTLLLPVVGAIVGLSFFLYYPVNRAAMRFGKKPVVIFAFGMLVVCFALISCLGLMDPVPRVVQIMTVGVVGSIPVAILGIT